jgi:sensor histidine kinase YesM
MSYLRITWSGITWRRLLFTQAMGQAAALLMTIDTGQFHQPIGRVSQHFVSMGLYVFCLLALALASDEVIRRGARPLTVTLSVTLINVLFAIAIAALTPWLYHAFAVPYAKSPWMFIVNGVHMAVYGTLGLLVYMNGRTADRMLEGLRGAELRRVQLDRQLVESRLATQEAQIDPSMLFSALAQIKRGFAESSPQAERRLNELIQTLRATLARTKAANESEGGE